MTRCARLIVALPLLALAACARGEAGPEAARTTAPIQPGAADIGFLTEAAAAETAALQKAQLAAERARGPAVKQFARQSVADHTSLDQQLRALAQRKGVAAPVQPDAPAMDRIRELQELHRGFDAVYVRDQLAAQERLVALFRQEAEQGADPDIKAFAQQNLPMLQQHVLMAGALDGQPVADQM